MKSLLLGWACLAAFLQSPVCAEAVTSPLGTTRLLLPKEGATLNSNAPVLAWSSSPAREIEIWIDGHRMETLAGDLRSYVPVPLSFGPHVWKIVCVRDDAREESQVGRFSIDDAPLAPLPEGALLLRHGWSVASSETVGLDGAKLSSPGVETDPWAKTSLPATVLTALVRNGVYPNPYYSLNNTRIPDSHDDFNREHDLLKFSHIPGKNPWKQPYWYRTSFTLPSAYAGKALWLTFNEINYRAEVWLNGIKLADKAEMAGMERRFRFDISSAAHLTGENVLAVAIFPLDNPGKPEVCPVTPLADPGRNMGADTDISLNYSKWDAIGWDWQPEIRDRDMGITEDVYVSASNLVEIDEPYVSTSLPLPDTSTAEVRVSFSVHNRSTTSEKVTLTARLVSPRGKTVAMEKTVDFASQATQRLEWTSADFAALRLKAPELWWPVGLGGQPLYTLELEARNAKGVLSREAVRFGVRHYTTRINPTTGSRIFTVNGKDVYGQGGNWVIDMMLNGTASRYEQDIRAAAHSRQNFLRVWGPTGVPPQAFFDAADRYGVMIQQDFLHDHWGTERNRPGCEPPLDLFEKASTDIIRRLRNHPSLFLWCGGNEGPNPRERLLVDKLLPENDPYGTRYYLPASLTDGLQGGGPYHNLAPVEYYNNHKISGFNSEIGPSGVPVWESLRKGLRMPPSTFAENRFPLDGDWAYHDANDRPGNDTRKFSALDDLLRHRFGSPQGTDLAAYRDYAYRAQFVGFEAYRASMESLNKDLWVKSTGFSIWKYNSSWPSLTWQISDWYLQFNAGFYGFRRALEPLHVQMNEDDHTVSVVNRTAVDQSGLTVEAVVYDSQLKPVEKFSREVVAKNHSSVATGVVISRPTELSYVKLLLKGKQGDVVSENFYWLEPQNHFSALAELPVPVLKVAAKRKGAGFRVVLKNSGKTLAVLLRLKLVDRESGEEILPTYWSDNYFSLLPGDRRELTAEVPAGVPVDDVAVEVVTGPRSEPLRFPVK